MSRPQPFLPVSKKKEGKERKNCVLLCHDDDDIATDKLVTDIIKLIYPSYKGSNITVSSSLCIFPSNTSSCEEFKVHFGAILNYIHSQIHP